MSPSVPPGPRVIWAQQAQVTGIVPRRMTAKWTHYQSSRRRKETKSCAHEEDGARLHGCFLPMCVEAFFRFLHGVLVLGLCGLTVCRMQVVGGARGGRLIPPAKKKVSKHCSPANVTRILSRKSNLSFGSFPPPPPKTPPPPPTHATTNNIARLRACDSPTTASSQTLDPQEGSSAFPLFGQIESFLGASHWTCHALRLATRPRELRQFGKTQYTLTW